MRAREDQVEVAVIAKALKDSGLTKTEVARNMGWFKTIADTTKLRRAIGEKPWYYRGNKQFQKHVRYDRAIELIEAMGLDPTDYGL